MVYPLNNGADSLHPYTFYQSVMAGELVCTLALFFMIQTIHYCIWGHQQQQYQRQKSEEGDSKIQPLPPSEWKWDQKSFNMYFAIIFGNHISAFILPFAYYPSILTCCLAWIHCGLFIGILINNVCVDEKDAGKGGKTITNRILWIIMCVDNLTFIGAGLYGIATVIA